MRSAAHQDPTPITTSVMSSADEGYTVSGIIRRYAAERPDGEMLVCGGERRTWAQQLRRSSQVAHALQAEGLGKGDRVAFLDHNDLAFFDFLFGGSLIGAVNVAVNWRLAAPELDAVINDAQAPLLVVHRDYLPTVSELSSRLPHVRRIVVLDGGSTNDGRCCSYDQWLSDRPSEDPGFSGRPQDISMQLYTSGTTGLPKGVMLSNANLAAAIGEAGRNLIRVDDRTVSLVAMPLFHISGSLWALFAMSRGGRSVIVRDMDPVELLRLVAAERVTETLFVPAVLMMLLATPQIAATDLSSLRNILYGASPISEEVLAECIKRFPCQFIQVYGMTETTGPITALQPEDHDPSGPRRHLLRSAGKPYESVELRVVLPESGEPAAVGQVGEVVTQSGLNMVGYWQQPDETTKVIDGDGWLRSGDAGYLDEAGYLFLYDRVKDMIVTGGENVYPAEVENALLAHPALVDAAVIGVPDDRWGEAVKAVVVLASGELRESAPPEAIIAFCHQRLAGYKCPKTVDYVDALPRNPSGKLLKRELRAPYWLGQDRNIG